MVMALHAFLNQSMAIVPLRSVSSISNDFALVAAGEGDDVAVWWMLQLLLMHHFSVKCFALLLASSFFLGQLSSSFW